MDAVPGSLRFLLTQVYCPVLYPVANRSIYRPIDLLSACRWPGGQGSARNILHPEEGTEDRLRIGPAGQLQGALSIKGHPHSRQPACLSQNNFCHSK
ncbi:hypothetical protein J6590_074173 [Homalodisca vitripennis]|nr:hypothetical protein J6590_074173 [Homalodisca vitripennis]